MNLIEPTYKGRVLESLDVEVKYKTDPGEGSLLESYGQAITPSFPPYNEVTAVLYNGRDITKFLDDKDLDVIEKQINNY